MGASGSGQGTPVQAPVFSSEIYDQMEELTHIPNCAVSLSRYAKLIGYNEAAFWGVIYDNQHLIGCDPLWNEYERMTVAMALAEAQQEIEQLVNYPLCPTWITGTSDDALNYNDRWVDQQNYRSSRLMTRYPRLIAAGVRKVDVIEAGSVIDHQAEISVVGPLATDAESTDEIHLYYPNSEREITPSKITLSNGNVTIEIPRYRMVKQEFLNTPEGGIRYETLGFFLTTVDVKRIYNDPSTQAVLVRPNCHNGSCAGGCSECTQSACIYLRDPQIGQVDVTPATWNTTTSSWDRKISCVGNYSIVRLNYLAGLRYLNLQAEQAIVRLAHSKMGKPPCQCDKTMEMWKYDYEVPNVLTRERLNCPFGLSNGAWIAYRWAMSLSSKRAAIF